LAWPDQAHFTSLIAANFSFIADGMNRALKELGATCCGTAPQESFPDSPKSCGFNLNPQNYVIRIRFMVRDAPVQFSFL
jgi:hypothetical protein